jgi:hypothetical protein
MQEIPWRIPKHTSGEIMKALWTILLSFCLSWIPGLAHAAYQGGGGLDLSFTGLVYALIYLIIAAIIVGLLYYIIVILIGPKLPAPIGEWVRVIFLVIVALFVILYLLHLLGMIH